MSGKTLFPTEGSPPGISAGAPFVVNEFTYVEQVTPPFLATQRLGRIADASQSIVAPGVLAGAGSLVLGRNVIDAANGPGAILIGDTISTNTTGGAGQGNNQTLIGANITIPTAATNSTNIVVLGQAVTFVSVGGFKSFGGSVAIGEGITISCSGTTDAQNVVAIGQGANVTEANGIAIGSGATVSLTEGIAIGQAAIAGSQSVGIGTRVNVGATSVGIGRGALGGTDSVAIGFGATTSGASSSIAIGRQASTLGATGAIAIGQGATNTVNNWALLGSRTFPVTTLRVGAGLNDATGGVVYTWQTTDVFGGAGNNLDGNTLIIAAGVGTGNSANAGNRGLDFQVGIIGAAGSTQQVYTSVLAIRHSDLNVALWGGLAAPFSSGKGVLYIANATTNPTVAAVAGGGILSVQGGNLHFLNAAGVDTALTPAAGGGGLPTTGGTMTGAILFNADNTIDIGASGATRARTIYLGTSVIAGSTPATTAGVGVRMSSGGNIQARNQGNTANVNLIGHSNVAANTITAGDGSNSTTLNLASSSVVQITNATLFQPLTDQAVGLGSSVHRWNALFVDGAAAVTLTNQTTTVGASAGTLTNCPAVGNPTGYLQININGAVGKIPYWT